MPDNLTMAKMFVIVPLNILVTVTDKISRVFNMCVAYQGCSSIAVDTAKHQRLSAGFNKIVSFWELFSQI